MNKQLIEQLLLALETEHALATNGTDVSTPDPNCSICNLIEMARKYIKA